MIEIICIALACISTIVCIVLLVNNQKQKRLMEQAEEQISHFLIYPEKVAKESLGEGCVYNLMNQVSKLEEQYLFEKERNKKREVQTNQFIENMAHQIKTSITALQIRLDFSMLQCENQKEKENLEKSQKCLSRLTNEVERLLISSQLAGGKVMMCYEKLNMEKLLKDCMDRMRILADRKKVSIELEGCLDAVYYGDEFWLTQAIENILKNAVEHTKESGKVRIFGECENGEIQICIEDEGDGIPQEELPFMFERFFRGNSEKIGYGIGLSMAKDIVTYHHGSLKAGNLEHGGACFLILLPILNGSEPYKIVSHCERKM